MGGLRVLLPLLLVLLLPLFSPAAVVSGSAAGKPAAGRGLFMLGRPRRVVKTEAGEVSVVSGRRWRGDSNPMHLGFVSMQPNSLLIPQYIDANLIIFVRRGEAKVGWMNKDRSLEERNLRAGDVNVVTAGSAFYVVNTRESERLHIICSLDSGDSNGFGSYESFFIGGGNNPTSVLSGFDQNTVQAALNITAEQVEMITKSQRSGPIIYLNQESNAGAGDAEEEGDDSAWWSLLQYLGKKAGAGAGEKHRAEQRSPDGSPDVYNIYEKKPSFANNYGWSTAVTEHDFPALADTDISLYLVNLTSGSMLAPHLNPRATEYGIVLGGSGTVQVVFPNGTTAMSSPVSEGDAFWIPRYFPFCQVASSEAPLELFGFTTSSRRNRPQFLAGASSVLRSMRGPELAAAFGISEEQLDELVGAQQEGVILPPQDRLLGVARPAEKRTMAMRRSP